MPGVLYSIDASMPDRRKQENLLMIESEGFKSGYLTRNYPLRHYEPKSFVDFA